MIYQNLEEYVMHIYIRGNNVTLYPYGNNTETIITWVTYALGRSNSNRILLNTVMPSPHPTQKLGKAKNFVATYPVKLCCKIRNFLDIYA